MFTASQMFPFWGKRGLKSEMAARDAQSLSEMQKVIQLKTISRVSEIYFDLFQTYKNIDLIRDRGALFSKIEDIAASRYATGMSSQQEVLMAQTEKYTLLEREEMLKQKILSLEAMLLSALGRASSESLGRPAERPVTKFIPSLNDVLKQGESHSPEIKSRQRMMEAAEAKLKMTRKEYFPDVTMNASVFPRGGEFENMYSLTASFNIPIYYKSKQRPAVQEANAGLNQAKHELEATKYMISAAIRDNYSMVRSAEKLMELYRNGLIPKTYQDFELAVSGYGTGRVDAIVAITRLKNLLDFETLYWTQYAEREKAIARMRAIIGGE
jgi:outer membrane protein TolC